MSGTLAMSTGFGRAADLTRVGLTLAPRPQRGRWIVLVIALVAAAFVGGAALGELLRPKAEPVVVRAPAPNAEQAQLRQQLDQARMELRVAEARGQELERQIDVLNQKLTESQDELTFIRKAREGRRH